MASPSRATASRARHLAPDHRRPAGQRRRRAVDVGQARSRLRRAAGPQTLLTATDEELRAAGISRQKAGYVRSLAELVLSGELDLANLPADDEEAIALLTKIKGIGRWSAEIYLLFAEGRRDVWPAGDLAVQVEIGRMLGLTERPTRKAAARARRSLAAAPRRRRGARLAQLQFGRHRALVANPKAMLAGAEPAEYARAEVEAEGCQFLALGVAAEE